MRQHNRNLLLCPFDLITLESEAEQFDFELPSVHLLLNNEKNYYDVI